jgi:hypothetical protein
VLASHKIRRELIGLTIAGLAAVVIGLSTDLTSPPRYDGAGYSVLGLSLATGHGYHEIDQPGEPAHAHFPPGYPAVLAGLWSLFGRSVIVAHGFSIACTVIAVWLAWRWFRQVEGRVVAIGLGLALVMNWTWSTNGGSIQSEPLFLLLSMIVVTKATSSKHLITGWWATNLGLGFLIGLTILTRHVGICLLAAVCLERLIKKQWREALLIGLVAAVVVAPWVAWVLTSRRSHQADLLKGNGLVALVGEQVLFYVRRLPDALTGPYIEVATVFARSKLVSMVATVVAFLVSSLILLGLIRLLKERRTRLAGLIPLCSLPLLLIWPFTEAGRFLVPLVPCLLLGLFEGLKVISSRFFKHPRIVACVVLVLVAVPYPAYALISGRAKSQRETHREFDAACAWIASEARVAGPVMTRHPGELFWQTGRKALAPASDDLSNLIKQVNEHNVAYLLVDPDRFANAPATPLSKLARAHPGRLKRVREGSVEVYEVLQVP